MQDSTAQREADIKTNLAMSLWRDLIVVDWRIECYKVNQQVKVRVDRGRVSKEKWV